MAQPYGLGESAGGRAPLGPPFTQEKWHSESSPGVISGRDAWCRVTQQDRTCRQESAAPWLAPSSAAHMLCDLGPVAYLSGPLFQGALLSKLPDTLRCTPYTPGSSPGLSHWSCDGESHPPRQPPAVSTSPLPGPGLQPPRWFWVCKLRQTETLQAQRFPPRA